MPLLRRHPLVYLFLLLSICSRAQFNYGHQMDFGKNRIQYKEFNWTYFDFDRFRVYSYQGGNEIAKYVAVSVNRQLPILEKRLEFINEDKINVLVYNNQNDFKQSNLGLSTEEQTNIGGVTRIIGDKISVYFNGSHAELDQQIRAALAELFISKLLFGGNAREMVRNSTLLNIPEWYTQGLVKYLSEGWSTYSDNIMYDDLKNNRFKSFNRLTGPRAAQAGHALWYFIVSTYGESQIPNILYMTRVTRGPENAFITTIGITLPNLIYDFTEAYQRRLFMFRDTLRRSPINNNSVLKRYKPYRRYYQLKVSPDGKQVVYARNELNQLRVYMKDIETGDERRLLKHGPRVEQIADYNYPLLGWHPNGSVVAMVYIRKDQLTLHMYDIESGEHIKRNLPNFEQVNSISFSDDGKKLAMSAVKRGKGQSDIFVFGLNTSAIEQLTNDIWDDQNPAFINGSSQIVFESNRVTDTLSSRDDADYFARMGRNMDLFVCSYPLKSKNLLRVTETPDVNEIRGQAFGRDLVYLSDRNGILNRYHAIFDSTIAFVDTSEHYRYFFKSKPVSNYDRNILEHHISATGSHVADVIYANGKDMLLVTELPDLAKADIPDPLNTWHRGFVGPAITDPGLYRDPRTEENIIPQRPPAKKGIDFENYRFENEKGREAANSQLQDTIRSGNAQTAAAGPAPFRFPIQRNYYTSFYTDYIVTQFDNAFLANNYQIYTGANGPIYLNPGFNFLSKVAISDLFEDQRIIGGFRINPNLDNEFMLAWEQRRRLWDHQVVLDRQTFVNVQIAPAEVASFNVKVNTSTVKYSIKYPFSPVAAVRFSVLYRNDRYLPLSRSDISLPVRPVYENLGGARVEYIFDNTRHIMLNIMNGLRFKVWTEYWKYYSDDPRDLFTSGFDVRHYQKVHRQITWCNRIAGGNSLGSDRLIFYLGGVDNWLNPTFNNNVNVVNPEQYGFQTLATNMRGFQQNIRNGNNFLVYNSELRIPLIRYLLDHPVRSDFLNNFQVVGFGDIGMAWTGFNPLSEENTENVKTFVQNDPGLGRGGSGVIVTVIDHKNPLVGGVGFGLRSRLLGYFVRLDFGWGIDNWEVQKRIVGLSLTTDF